MTVPRWRLNLAVTIAAVLNVALLVASFAYDARGTWPPVWALFVLLLVYLMWGGPLLIRLAYGDDARTERRS